jgi:transcription antitermination factor NusB
MRKRTRARELALQILYQADLRGDEVLDDLSRLLEESGKGEDVREFARELVVGTRGRTEDLDRMISEVAEHWDVRRMATVDRNIIRMAVFEMLERDDIPRKVSINEAIELGKKYSTQQSGAFINGILDRIRRGLEEPDGEDGDGGRARG